MCDTAFYAIINIDEDMPTVQFSHDKSENPVLHMKHLFVHQRTKYSLSTLSEKKKKKKLGQSLAHYKC